MNHRLAPCPKCGSWSVKIVNSKGKRYAHCMACQYSGLERETAREAMETWNEASKKGARQ